MLTRSHWAAALFVSSLFFLSLSPAEEKPAASPGYDKPAGALVPRPTVKVERGRLAASLALKGVVEGDAMAEISVRLRGWSGPLVVEQAVAHGAQVKKGDRLLTFDSEKITQAVNAAREERELAELTIRQAELDLPLLKQQLPLDLLAAERKQKRAAEDLARFLKVDKPRHIEEAKFSLKSAEFHVLSSKDELTQLEKMYRDKDLTEETEQMILKRYRFALESAEFTLRGTQLSTEHSLTTDLPRREESALLAADEAKLAWERAREQLPLQVRQKELALEKLRFDDRRAREKLVDLEKDLTLMTVKAPADGIAYHGRYAVGQWAGPQSTAYLKGGTLPANETVLTVVSGGRLFLRADVDEKEIADLKVGQSARISLTGSPRRRLAGRVDQAAAVPLGGKFEVRIALTEERLEAIVPGLTGSARIVTGQKDNALAVPSSAVFEDPDTDTFFVYLPGEPPKKKTVKTGLVTADKTEIVEGLAEGGEILAARP
jgi:multidrug efflux pump subunit AcrA (membrane-fusion protein)